MAAKRTEEILRRLDEVYGTEYVCYLDHETPWQLLIAVILSAQCTDARVNIVTKDLFKKYDSLEKFANADLKELERDIRPTGFYYNKAKNIIACARRLVQERKVDFLGTDAHRTYHRPPSAAMGLNWLYENVEQDYADAIAWGNAQKNIFGKM